MKQEEVLEEFSLINISEEKFFSKWREDKKGKNRKQYSNRDLSSPVLKTRDEPGWFSWEMNAINYYKFKFTQLHHSDSCFTQMETKRLRIYISILDAQSESDETANNGEVVEIVDAGNAALRINYNLIARPICRDIVCVYWIN